MNSEPAFYQNTDKSSDVWLTPPSLIAALGSFDLDPCCPNNLTWKTAEKRYSLEDGQDGLLLDWGGRVWLNPPYSNWVPFVEKLKNHGNGIALISARTETKGWFDHVWHGADSILFVKRRIKFLRQDGSKAGSATAPSVLVAYGPNNTEAIETALAAKAVEGYLVYLKS